MSSAYAVRIFMKCTHVCADGITEPRPDMNIKVTAFTMTQNLDYTNLHHLLYVVCASSASS